MKKIKLSIVVSVFLALLLTPIHADGRAVATRCPKCYSGVVSKRTQRSYKHDETFNCQHGKKYDLYAVYEVTTIESCNQCGYSSTSSYEDHVFKGCIN